MKQIVLFLAAMLVPFSLFAQGEMDALRYSENDLTGGTARGMAMAGAFGALGGDITGIAINPAGIGVYRSSEIVGTLNFENVASKAGVDTENKFKFNFDNIAYVGYFPTGGDVFKSYQFGFSYNRLKNLDRTYRAVGGHINGSLTDFMADMANRSGAQEGNLGIESGDLYWPFQNNQDWLATFGYNGYLIDPPGSRGENHFLSILDPGELIDNDLLVKEQGSIAAYDFTLGTNVSDILSLGITLSITDIRYKMYSSYIENPFEGGEFELENWIETNGTGYGVKLGAIFRPTDAVRIGAAYHSPTWYDLSDTYSANLFHMNMYDKGESTPYSGDHDSKQVYRPEKYPGDESLYSGEYYYDYKLKTPGKWVFSLAGVIENWAILSLDYEMKDYTGMDFDSADGLYVDYRGDNKTIDRHYRNASTVKFGAEFRLTPQFSVRGGYAWMQSPLKTNFRDYTGIEGETEVRIGGSITHHLLEGDANFYTFGFGYRFTPQFYIDVASVVRTQDSDLYAFPRVQVGGNVLAESQPTSFSNKTFKGLVTLGYKF